jgi:hypothetical protein
VFNRGFFLTWNAVRRQLAAMPNAFYFIRLIHGATRKPCPGERVWDAGQLVRGSVVRFLRARNQQGYDIYLLPYADQCNAGYILIDLDHATPDVVPLISFDPSFLAPVRSRVQASVPQSPGIAWPDWDQKPIHPNSDAARTTQSLRAGRD